MTECTSLLLSSQSIATRRIHIFSSCSALSTVTPALKTAIVGPSWAKKNYLPISNLSFMSEVMEQLVSKQLPGYLHENNLIPTCLWSIGYESEVDLLQAGSTGFSPWTPSFRLEHEYQQPSWMTRVDRKVAFNSVDREALWFLFLCWCLLAKIVELQHALTDLYTDNQSIKKAKPCALKTCLRSFRNAQSFQNQEHSSRLKMKQGHSLIHAI